MVAHYDLANLSLADGVSELSRNPDVPLHLGFEEVLRERFGTPRDRSVRFSLHLENRKILDILDALCAADPRYGWSVDGSTINVFTKARAQDKTDLLNFWIRQIRLIGVPDPDQALTPLTKLFPQTQIGYMELGGRNAYSEPWTVTFNNLTVRQFANRIAGHMGARTAWIWQGGKDGRAFSFIRGGYHAQ
ncbi:MAG TPA: hypothetical protein VHD76_01170 [Bryobacteraceae bacterium]|jgi:hypothetical protein|nr:hypothetical protein [Bryobacteraceae bacterium]